MLTDEDDKMVVDPEQTKVEMTQIVLPSHTNNHDTAFGGQIAAWVDICAAVSAQRFCRCGVVTASMDELHFLHPVKKGMVVVLRSQVNRSWNSSMEVGVRVEAENPITGTVLHCCSAYLTFVAIDGNGGTVSVPELDTKKEHTLERRAKEAQMRRDNRLKMRKLRLQENITLD
jgi:acyl-CoA hydrolase